MLWKAKSHGSTSSDFFWQPSHPQRGFVDSDLGILPRLEHCPQMIQVIPRGFSGWWIMRPRGPLWGCKRSIPIQSAPEKPERNSIRWCLKSVCLLDEFPTVVPSAINSTNSTYLPPLEFLGHPLPPKGTREADLDSDLGLLRVALPHIRPMMDAFQLQDPGTERYRRAAVGWARVWSHLMLIFWDRAVFFFMFFWESQKTPIVGKESTSLNIQTNRGGASLAICVFFFSPRSQLPPRHDHPLGVKLDGFLYPTPSKMMVSDPQTQQIDYLAASSRTVNGQRHGEGNLLALLLIDHHMT